MLTRGEFVVNKQATAKHLPLLQSINSGSLSGSTPVMSASTYARSGGIINAIHKRTGGIINPVYAADGLFANGAAMISKATGFDMSGVSSVFNGFIKSFDASTNNFGSLIDNLARVFPALGGPVSAFGGHVDRLIKALDGIKNIEIKGPNIPDTININSDTIRVELISPPNVDIKGPDAEQLTKQLELKIREVIGGVNNRFI
jgi:hypothetical protein